VNHLAHALLAAHDDRAIVGALLSDVVKGRGPDAYSPAVKAEILLHRHVDVFTDAHPAVRAALARFAPGRRRFAGIALDVHFDHVLARGWARHGDGGALEAFSLRVCDAIDSFDEALPPVLATMSARWRRHGGLASYRDPDAVGFALDRLSERLSRGGEHLRAAREDLRVNAAVLDAAFEDLWPDLRAYVAATRATLLAAR
jgi:acyl carrier protein phosphodiesterase